MSFKTVLGKTDPPRLKKILNTILAMLMVCMLLLTVFGAYLFISNYMTKNVREMVRAEFQYIGGLIDHVYENEDAGGLWLDGYTLGEDSESFLYATIDGTIINGSNMETLLANNITSVTDLGYSVSMIKEMEKTGEPQWLTLYDGNEYAVYAAYYEPGWDIIAGISKSYLYRDVPIVAVSIIGVFSILFLVLFMAVSKFLDKAVIRSLQAVEISLQKITEGDLEERVNIHSSKEFSSLSQGINQTVDSLKAATIRSQAAAWMERELSLASEIQLSAMPRETNHTFSEDSRFSLYADIKTAKEVGGDFYDYFIMGENRLGFVIADVSGKGIPAAMFMMTAKTHIKLYMEQGGSLSEAFFNINQKLCEHNDVEMFVTVFAGVVDLETMELRYVNAGHNPSVLIHDGSAKWLKEKSGPLIGMLEDATYRELQLQLSTGDLLFLYTDGITEAANADKTMIGTKRLEKLILENSKLSTQEVAESVYTDVVNFEQGASRGDDITMLLLKVGGNKNE